MHYHLEVTINNEYFDVNVNFNIIRFLNQFNTTNENWYSFKLTKSQIQTLKNLTTTEKELDFIKKITPNTTVDILEHFYF